MSFDDAGKSVMILSVPESDIKVVWTPDLKKFTGDIFYASREYILLGFTMQVWNWDESPSLEPVLVLATGDPVLPRILPLRFIERIDPDRRILYSAVDLEPE